MKTPEAGFFNWSGGKDSTLALHELLQDPTRSIHYLLTTVNEKYNRVSMHGVRESLLIAQAESIGIPLYQVRLPESPDMAVYEACMSTHMAIMKEEGLTFAAFGDIFLEDLRKYREDKLNEIGMNAVFPLWKRDTTALIRTFIDLGYKTIVVCAQEGLEDFCGRVIDESFLNDLPAEVDPCGENGEFHTFVFDGPVFSHPVLFQTGEKVHRTFPAPADSTSKPQGYWYIDLDMP